MTDITVYISRQCPNSTRFVQSLHLIPSMKARARIIDVASLDAATLSRVQFVPTVVMSDGRAMVGTKAFEWLKDYDGEVELTPPPSGSMAFSDLEFEGTHYVEGYASFEPLPE